MRGRAIEVLEFGTGPRTALILAGVHGDEPSGVMVARALIAALSTIPAERLRGIRVCIMPAVNPDGLEAGTRVNANLVDINRNFPTLDFGTGPDAGQYYGGEAPGSEPETRAVIQAVEMLRPELIISVHAPLGCVNYNGPSEHIARLLSEALGLPAVDDVGYPCPGSMGTCYGKERGIPLITLELPPEAVRPEAFSDAILSLLLRTAQDG